MSKLAEVWVLRWEGEAWRVMDLDGQVALSASNREYAVAGWRGVMSVRARKGVLYGPLERGGKPRRLWTFGISAGG